MRDDENILTFNPEDDHESQRGEAVAVESQPGGEEESSSAATDAQQNDALADGAILKEMDRLKGEVDDLRELYLRKLAEFDNFRKRVEREKQEFRKLANEDLVRDLIPVLDNFSRAVSHEGETDLESFKEGVELIARQLQDVLARQGLEEIDPLGEPFNPEFHDAVQRVEDSQHEPGTVVAVLAKGYTLGGRLLRPAMVAVAMEPAGGSGTQNGEG
ncbi:MAG TPA: nucleotide exchange factor GrpE [Acidobacteria bacterium]|nr:nucleotide exchange factor GrpE [Acidobacteriota bacterium]